MESFKNMVTWSLAKLSAVTRVQDPGDYPLILLGPDKFPGASFSTRGNTMTHVAGPLIWPLRPGENPFFLWAPIKADILSWPPAHGPE